MTPTLLLLAAGRGTRFGGTKQLAPVGPGGEPLLAYTIHDAVRGGFERIVLVCPEGLGPEMAETFRGWAPPGVRIEAVEQSVPPERTKPWGTGHAILTAEAHLRQAPFGVANGDDFYGRSALTALGRALAEPARATQLLVGYRLANTLVHTEHVSRGICVLSEGRLVAIDEVLDVHMSSDEPETVRGRSVSGEAVEATGDEPVSMNLWGFVPPFPELLHGRWADFLDSGPDAEDEFLLPQAVAELIAEGRTEVEVISTDAVPFGLTRPEDLETVRTEITRLVASGDYPADLRSDPEAR